MPWKSVKIPKEIQDTDKDTGWRAEQAADEDHLRGRTKGTEVFDMDDAGILTLVKQSAARAHIGGDTHQTIPTADYTKVELATETYDIQGEFDSTTHYRFTATNAGIYLITGQVNYISPVVNKQYSALIFKNGVTTMFPYVHSSTTDGVTSVTIDILSLAAGDYVELWTYHNAGGNELIDKNYTFMAVIKLQ